MKQLIPGQPSKERVHPSAPLSIKQRRMNGAPDGIIRFGRYRVLLRQRQLIADGVRVELGTRAFDLLLVLLEANGSLVTKDELLVRVWLGIVVTEENLKVQISALRRAFGEDRDFIRTEFGRGYRFTATVRLPAWSAFQRRSIRRRRRSSQASFSQRISSQPALGWQIGDYTCRRFDSANREGSAFCRDYIRSGE